ncbi:MAG: hypothetical protein RR144_02740 [Clostridia bacterium]
MKKILFIIPILFILLFSFNNFIFSFASDINRLTVFDDLNTFFDTIFYPNPNYIEGKPVFLPIPDDIRNQIITLIKSKKHFFITARNFNYNVGDVIQFTNVNIVLSDSDFDTYIFENNADIRGSKVADYITYNFSSEFDDVNKKWTYNLSSSLSNSGVFFNTAVVNYTDTINYISDVDIFTDSTLNTIYKPGYVNNNIKLNVKYNNDNTEALVTANVTNASFSDKLYYSKIAPGVNGLNSKSYFPSNGIKINNNCSLFFEVRDTNNNIKYVNSVQINKIGVLNSKDFNVDFKFTSSSVIAKPWLFGADFQYYDIYYRISKGYSNFPNSNNIDTTPLKLTSNNEELYFFPGLTENKFTIEFVLKLRGTEKVVLTKTFDINFKPSQSGLIPDNDTSIGGGTINGQPDSSLPGVNIDPNNPTGSIENMINYFKSFFEVIKMIFFCIPTWISVPLGFLLTGLVVITLIKAVRGG